MSSASGSHTCNSAALAARMAIAALRRRQNPTSPSSMDPMENYSIINISVKCNWSIYLREENERTRIHTPLEIHVSKALGETCRLHVPHEHELHISF